MERHSGAGLLGWLGQVNQSPPITTLHLHPSHYPPSPTTTPTHAPIKRGNNRRRTERPMPTDLMESRIRAAVQKYSFARDGSRQEARLQRGGAEHGLGGGQGGSDSPHSGYRVEAGLLGSHPALFGSPRSPSRDRRGPGVPGDEAPCGKAGLCTGGQVPGQDQDREDQRELPPPDISTKPLQGRKLVFKRGRLLGLMFAPPARPNSGAAAEAGRAGKKCGHPRVRLPGRGTGR